jgi:hypothetical protein
MFTTEEIRGWCKKFWALPISGWNAETPATRDKAWNFYHRWYLLMRQLINEGHDNNGTFLGLAVRLVEVLRSNPEKISFVHPFVGDTRDVEKTLLMYNFFNELEVVCRKKEQAEKKA